MLSLSLEAKEAIEFVRNLKNMNLSFAALFPDLDGFAFAKEKTFIWTTSFPC
jgi:hypothetical protein